MEAILPGIFGLAGTLLGAGLSYVLQRRTAKETRRSERQERRNREFLNAVGAYSSAVSQLRRAEHDRAKKRLTNAPEEEREDARQETYRLRSDASSAYYRLRLWADPRFDDDFLEEGERIVEITKNITTYTETEAEMEELSSTAKNALEAFVRKARQKADEIDPS
jgi:hypothetical protein